MVNAYADINAYNTFNETSLMSGKWKEAFLKEKLILIIIACFNNKLDIVNYLLDLAAYVDFPDSKGQTALFYSKKKYDF